MNYVIMNIKYVLFCKPQRLCEGFRRLYVYRFGLPVLLVYLSLPTSVTLCCLKFYPNHSQ